MTHEMTLIPEAHGPQWLTWVNSYKSLIQHFNLSVTMARNQNEEFAQNFYAWWRTALQTFLKRFCPNTDDSHYVDFAYLDSITYVIVIFHSQHFFSIYLCSSTPSMSKTVNMKQRVSRGDFSCPRCIFYYICYCLCQSPKSALARAPYCLLRLGICIIWGAKTFQTMVKNN